MTSYSYPDPIVITVTPQTPTPIPVNDIIVGGVNNPVVAYHHIQNVSSASWVINHNLGWKPNVTVQDSAGTTVEGEIVYTNNNSLTLNFTGAFTGNAYLS